MKASCALLRIRRPSCQNLLRILRLKGLLRDPTTSLSVGWCTRTLASVTPKRVALHLHDAIPRPSECFSLVSRSEPCSPHGPHNSLAVPFATNSREVHDQYLHFDVVIRRFAPVHHEDTTTILTQKDGGTRLGRCLLSPRGNAANLLPFTPNNSSRPRKGFSSVFA
jgi:hypothetical protein